MDAMKPLGKLKDTALGTIKHPLGTTQKAAGAAVGTARGAAQGVVHGVSGLLPGRKPDTPEREHPPAQKAAKERKLHGDPVAPKTARTAAPSNVSAKTAPAKTAPAKKAPTKKAPTKKAPTKKASVKKAPAKKAAAKTATKSTTASRRTADAPLTAAQVAAGEGTEVTTQAGTTGADVGTNPNTADTGLEQPGTEPLIDPATVKAVASEAEMMQKGADLDKG